MSDIKGQLIKNSYNYVLQSDLISGIVYRIGGDVPTNPKFISGLTINTSFTYSDGSEVNGYVLTSDASGNATWKPVSGSTQSSGEYLPLSGGTVTGGTIFQSGLTANTISATTYYNLPTDVYVTGGTYSAGTSTFTNNTGGTFNVTGFSTLQYFVTGSTPSGMTLNNGDRWFDTTTGDELVWINDGDSSQWLQICCGGGGILVGDYLPLSGGTVTGPAQFTNGLTANIISATTYQNLPISGLTEGQNISITGTNGNFTISVTGVTSGSNFTGGTVSGSTNFTNGLTANTISATTYYNLPVSAVTNGFGISASTSNGTVTITNTAPDQIVTISGGTGITTGGTYPNFTIINSAPDQTVIITGGTNIQISGSYPSFGVNFTGTTGSNFTGGTVSGPTNFTSGLTANTISATTYYNLPISGLTAGQNISISGSNGNFTISVTGITSGSNFTGGTVSGATNFTNGLTANTISATTYYNLPTDVFVTGGTYSAGTATFTNNTGGTFNVTGFSTSLTGAYLPLSGGTVTGPTIFQSGLTANTISATSINRVDYVVFNTGTTSASTVPGTVYFDNVEKALSYNTSLNQGVTVNLGQQNYLRVFNNSGLSISKGKVVQLLSSFSGLPTVELAINKHINGRDVVGVAAETIPNNSEGIVLTYGIISNITVTGGSIGSLVYASDIVPGEFKNATEFLNFPLTARTNAVGYVIQTGTTNGKLFVNPVNENYNLSITDLQRNVLEGNVISTGVFSFSGITLASSNTFNVGPMEAWIVDNTTNPLVPDVLYVNYSGQTNVPSLYYSSATETYLLITSGATLIQQTTFPTPQQRRQNVYLGKMGHGNRTSLINAFNEPDLDVSPLSQLRDMFSPIKLINENVYPSPNTGLTFNTSSGTLWGLGIGFVTNQLNPSSITITANTPTTFQYRTQTGGTATNITTIDPANYDLNGIITSIGSPAKQATNQRIFLLQNGQFRIQYGQTKYADLTTAIAAVTTESFTTFSNFRDNAILIAILSIRSDATLLSDIAQAKITFASKFGESVGGTGGISTTNLQQAYDNSSSPAEIITNSTLGALHIKNGSGNPDNVSSIFDAINAAGVSTAFMRADGLISGSSVSTPGFTANTTGITASTVNIKTIGSGTSITNLGIDSSGNVVSGSTANPSGTFTGGTVTGPTIFTNGLTANTISATTYYNLPTDVYVTGGTYSAGTATFTNNTGGTFDVTGIITPFTGGTVSGPTNFTGGLTANTISATTYLNLPVTPIHIKIASMSGRFTSASRNYPNIDHMYVGNTNFGWSYGDYDYDSGPDGFGNIRGIKWESSNIGIPLPTDILSGDKIKICGMCYGLGGAAPLNETFYVTVSYFTCANYLPGKDFNVTTLIPAASYVLGETRSICFSEEITTNTTLPGCTTYLVVGMTVGNETDSSNTYKFSYTLDSTQTTSASANLFIRNCCDPAYSEVIQNNGVAVGKSFVDGDGNCWSVISETTSDITGNRSLTTEYDNCVLCIDSNTCPQNFIVQSCCGGGSETFTAALEGITVGSTFVDDFGFCWSVMDTTPTPITNVVTIGTVYPSTTCDSAECTDANTCPNLLLIESCCKDMGAGYTTSAILGISVTVGDVFVDTFGICWIVSTENNVGFPNLNFLNGSTIYGNGSAFCEDCFTSNNCEINLFYTVQNCCDETVEVVELPAQYSIDLVLGLVHDTGMGCYDILSWSDVGTPTLTGAKVISTYVNEGKGCINCIGNFLNNTCIGKKQCCTSYLAISDCTITGYLCDGTWVVEQLVPNGTSVCMALVYRISGDFETSCCTFLVYNPSPTTILEMEVTDCKGNTSVIGIRPLETSSECVNCVTKPNGPWEWVACP